MIEERANVSNETPESSQRSIDIEKDTHVNALDVIKALNEDLRNLRKNLDPNGLSQHELGAKLDANKPRVSLVLSGFARALWAISEVGTYGAVKYTDKGWESVPNGQERYEDAEFRHTLKRWMGEDIDQESELNHMAHEAWNALAKLELRLRELEGVDSAD